MFAYLTEYCKADHTQAAIQMFRQARLIDPLHVNARGKIEKTNSFACLFFLNVFLVMNVFISDRLLGDCWSFSCCGSYCDWALGGQDRCFHCSRSSFSSRWWRQVSLHRIRWLLEVGPGFTAGAHSNRFEGLVDASCRATSLLVYVGEDRFCAAVELCRLRESLLPFAVLSTNNSAPHCRITWQQLWCWDTIIATKNRRRQVYLILCLTT